MSSSPSRPSTERQPAEDPGAYPIPFSFEGVELGSRLDSIRPSARYWAVDSRRAGAPWHNDFVKANNRYEEWLSEQPPGEYPVPFRPADGQRIDEIKDSLRRWGVHEKHSSKPWYNFFLKANHRYEQHIRTVNEAREPGEFPYPPGNNRKYTDMPIKDVPQDVVWWALRASNENQSWYLPLSDANKRLLDEMYKHRSPGSEPIWFGTRYKGLRLDQVYQRKSFMRWCFHPDRAQKPMFRRLRDLVDRLEGWRREHPEHSGPRQRRKAPNIQNPVGEALGPWDDALGSADEDEYDTDSFIQSDSSELEYDEEGAEESDDTSDSDKSMSSSMKKNLHLNKRKRTNKIESDEELEGANESARTFGKRYRVPCESAEE